VDGKALWRRAAPRQMAGRLAWRRQGGPPVGKQSHARARSAITSSNPSASHKGGERVREIPSCAGRKPTTPHPPNHQWQIGNQKQPTKTGVPSLTSIRRLFQAPSSVIGTNRESVYPRFFTQQLELPSSNWGVVIGKAGASTHDRKERARWLMWRGGLLSSQTTIGPRTSKARGRMAASPTQGG